MKEKIIEIIGHGMEPERAELKAMEIIIAFNELIVEKLKDMKGNDLEIFVNSIFISI